MQIIIPEWADLPRHIGAFCTTRKGGVSAAPFDNGMGGGGLNLGMHVGDNPQHVEKNRALLQTLLPASPLWLTQIHGMNVIDAGSDGCMGAEADAAITTQSGVVCAIQTADCLPVLLCDLEGHVVGAAHAGWRGLAYGILQNTIAKMQSSGAVEITAWLGPAIGSNQFEVGRDVLDIFVERAEKACIPMQAVVQTQTCFIPVPDRPGKYLADIYGLARIALQQVGVRRISGGGLCTVSDRRFYSYRRDRITGRMASLIWIK